MATAFKASCVVYWITAFFCATYLIGTSLYTDRFISQDMDSIKNLQVYIMELCIFNICYSFIGCVFLKCNITHIIYVVLFVFPMLGVNCALSIMGLIASKNTLESFPSPAKMIKNAVEYLKAHENKYPIWMYHVQETSNCCGIVSYLDFPAFLYTEETKLEDSLPSNCCYNSRDKKCTHNFNLKKEPKVLHKDIASVYLDQVKQCKIAEPDYVTKEIIPMIRNKREYYLLSDMKPILPSCGCYHEIKNAFRQLFSTAHFIFFVTILAMTAIMLFVYIKNWCNTLVPESGSSDHSLDVGNTTQQNIPPVGSPGGSQEDLPKSSMDAMPEKSMALTKVNVVENSSPEAEV